jgi:uncharacterized integral membrane protein
VTNLRLALIVTVATLLVIFTAQNYEVVELRFLFWKLEMSRAILMFGFLSAGSLIGWLSRGIGTRR